MKKKFPIPYFLQKELEKDIKEREIRKKIMVLGRCRTFKEFLIKKMNYMLADELMEKGLTKFEANKYIIFARFCLARMFRDGIKYVDHIFDMAEERFIVRDGLKPEIVRDVEIFLINYVNEAPSFVQEYEQIKRWYEGYVKELEKKGRRRL